MPKQPTYLTADEVRDTPEAEPAEYEFEKNGGYESLQHESFTIERPKRVAKIPVGEYVAEIKAIQQRKEPSYDDKNVLEDKVVVEFEVDGVHLQRRMNLKFHPKAKLSQFLQAALGYMPDNIPSDELVGKKVRVTILHNESNGNVYENIVDFKPAR
ncbi:MAG: hypothetical protein ABSC64_02100 [Candidatus Korobacteraceae bacterium]